MWRLCGEEASTKTVAYARRDGTRLDARPPLLHATRSTSPRPHAVLGHLCERRFVCPEGRADTGGIARRRPRLSAHALPKISASARPRPTGCSSFAMEHVSDLWLGSLALPAVARRRGTQ